MKVKKQKKYIAINHIDYRAESAAELIKPCSATRLPEAEVPSRIDFPRASISESYLCFGLY